MTGELNLDYSLLIPEFMLAGLAAILVAFDLYGPRARKDLLPYLSAAGLIAALAVSLGWVNKESDFAGILFIDNYTTFFRVFFIGTAAAITLASSGFVKDRVRHAGEYYALIVVSTIGAIYMAASRELLSAYISLELLSFSLYVLVSITRNDLRAAEGGMKYMLLGAFSSALFLYGISLIYGIAGTTYYEGIAERLASGATGHEFALIASLALLVTGLGFKVAAVPFHMWTPDAYEGAPLPITAYLSATSKAAGFAFILRFFAGALLPVTGDWDWMIAGLAAATILLGNLVALQQTNIKRLLAYSSIGQVGYMLMGVAALSPETASAIVLHMTGYVVTNLAAFTVIIAWYNITGKEEIADFRGMAERAPLLAAVLAAALFSLAGMPLFAGFLTKFMLFQATASEGFLWLSVIGITMSVVSLFYYLQVMKQLYVGEPVKPGREAIPWVINGLVVGLALGMFYVGLYPQHLFEAVENATGFLFT